VRRAVWALLACILFFTALREASATVVIQTIPNLTVDPTENLCNGCARVYQNFSLTSKTSLTSASFVVGFPFNIDAPGQIPVPLELSFWQDVGGTPEHEFVWYDYTPSQFTTSEIGDGPTIVTVSLPNLNLAAGDYFLSVIDKCYHQPDPITGEDPLSWCELMLEPFDNPGNSIYYRGQFLYPVVGDHYIVDDQSIGLILQGELLERVAVPEASTAAFLGGGVLGMIFTARRRRRHRSDRLTVRKRGSKRR
jgi:hypothetical protein